ncbi:MAG: hypothetical protein V3S41_09165 [Spirochaetia bacterium]
MTIRKTMLTGLVPAVALLLVLSACDITLIFGDTPGTDPAPDGLSFSLEWTDNGSDTPHLYVTYPAPADGDTTNQLGTPTFVEPYFSPADGGDLGFDPIDIGDGIPNEASDTRGSVYFGNIASDFGTLGIPAVELTDISDASEVIYVRGFPFASLSTDVSTTGGGVTGLATGLYTWVGVMEVYAYATSGRLAYASGAGVGAVLNVFDTGALLASYELPANTDLRGSSIVRINLFYEGNTEVYQLVPDIRVIQSTTQIRSVAPGGVIDESGIITIRKPVVE